MTMPLRAIDRMILIRVKTEWAKKHLRNLAAESLTLKHTAILTPDEKTGVPPNPITILWGDVPTVPTINFDALCLAGDIVHNLRAGLDHLAQQLALVYTPTLSDKELKGVEFPISEISTKYETDKARKVKGINPEAVKAIDALQPYGDGNSEFSSLLWRLHALDNIDKHRNLFTIGPEFIFTSSWFSGTYHLKTNNPHFAGLETDVEKDIKLAIEEAIDKTKVGQTQALLPTLRELAEMVDEVIKRFERFLE
jgi:hypothetical protein